jgi:hypothetical protein
MKIGAVRILAGFALVMALAGSTFLGTRIEAHPTIGLGSFENSFQTGRNQTMSNSISTLLTRNLYDVFGENDAARRRAAMNEIYTDDIVFYDQPGKHVYRGRDEIDRVAGALRAQHPDFRYTPIAEPEEVGNGGRVRWVEGRHGDAPAVAGTDFIIARDGRIAAIYFFFDKRP